MPTYQDKKQALNFILNEIDALEDLLEGSSVCEELREAVYKAAKELKVNLNTKVR